MKHTDTGVHRVLFGDALDHLRRLPDSSLDSLVTDPPAGISFMGKDWDSDKGGRDEWIAWLTEVMRECLRVLKPGAHGLVWSIPRTSHWTATALEDAGFEVRDCITHLFGQGFPKSLDISKAIDKAAGATREVVREGFTSSDEEGQTYAKGLNAGFQSRQLTAPATDAAKQWQGFGTALKPAAEFWWLIRKPIAEKTVAKNVLKHGTGGLNIDGCRIESPDANLSAVQRCKTQHSGKTVSLNNAGHEQSTYNPQGRFPSNLVLSHDAECAYLPDRKAYVCQPGCAVAELDAQSGFSKSPAKVKQGKRSTGAVSMGSDCERVVAGHSDSGGASRFFFQAKYAENDKETACQRPGSAIASANSAEPASSLLAPLILDSAQSLAPVAEALADKRLSSSIARFTNAIRNGLKKSGASSIEAIQITGERCLRELERISTSRSSPAKSAAIQTLTGITTTILSLSKSYSSAEPATSSTTLPNSALGAKDSVSRFIYCAKVSASERNAGLEGMPDQVLARSNGAKSGNNDDRPEYNSEALSGYDKRILTKNHHPTVKPLKLMRYLCRLITPPGGTVLDPFTGSGSTGVAAIQEGFRFLGIEREPGYVAIAERRIQSAEASA